MYLKFVNRAALIPTSESFMIQCDSFEAVKKIVEVGKSIDEYGGSYTYWLFTDGEQPPVEEETSLLVIHTYGAPGFEWVAATDVIMFVMNDKGETIDRITI